MHLRRPLFMIALQDRLFSKLSIWFGKSGLKQHFYIARNPNNRLDAAIFLQLLKPYSGIEASPLASAIQDFL